MPIGMSGGAIVFPYEVELAFDLRNRELIGPGEVLAARGATRRVLRSITPGLGSKAPSQSEIERLILEELALRSVSKEREVG